MANNTIIKSKNNPVIINIQGVDLTAFLDIRAAFNNDVRLKSTHPASIVVKSPTQLYLYFNDTNETKQGFWTIDGIDAEHIEGRELVGPSMGKLGRTLVAP